MGRVNDALRHAAIAGELDHSAAIRANHSCVLHFAGRHTEAIELARTTLAEFPESLRARSILALALLHIGETGEAIKELEAVYQASRTMPMLCGALGHAYAVNAQRSAARRILHHIENLPPRRCDFGSQALVHVGLGNLSGAIELFERAAERREFLMVLLGVDHRVDPVRSLPAFQSVLARIGLK